MAPPAADWPPLAPGETLLWEGRPRADLRFGIESLGLGLFGLVLLAVAGGFAWAVAGDAPGLVLPLVGGAAALAVALLLAWPLMDRHRRRHTRYALTDRRAFVDEPRRAGRVPQDDSGWPLTDPDTITLRPGPPDSVVFARRANLQRHGRRHRLPGFDVGFERIDDGAALAQRMREIATANARG